MNEELKECLRNMPDAKRIAVAIYGESVAAYRYGVLAQKATAERHREAFSQMQKEELGHQRALQTLADECFPEGDFLLTDEDKELVIVGTRILETLTPGTFARAMQFLHDTEERTSEFYQTLYQLMPEGRLGAFLKEMAGECRTHAASLLEIECP